MNSCKDKFLITFVYRENNSRRIFIKFELFFPFIVFIFFVNYNRSEQQTQIRKFYEEKHKTQIKKMNNQPIRKTHDENDFMSYDTLEEFNGRKRWKLIIDNVIKNPQFYACISSHNRKTFSIK